MTGNSMPNLTVQRRTSMPQELEDPEDLTAVADDMDKYTELETTSKSDLSWTEKILQLPKEVRNIVAGGIAGMMAKSVVAPLDRIKILYQVTNVEFRLHHIPKVAHNIVTNEGFSALWKGNLATMLRVFPYSGIQFMVFDRLKVRYLSQHNESDINMITPVASDRKYGLTAKESLIAGMMAGTVSVIFTYPLDLARAQLAVLRKHKHAHNRGFLELMADNYRHRGVAGLFRGITVTLFGILPYSGIAFAINEQSKREVSLLVCL
jgi:Mitochondrial carrier protein